MRGLISHLALPTYTFANGRTRLARTMGGDVTVASKPGKGRRRSPMILGIDWAMMPWTFPDILAKAFPPTTHVIANDEHPLAAYLFGRE